MSANNQNAIYEWHTLIRLLMLSVPEVQEARLNCSNISVSKEAIIINNEMTNLSLLREKMTGSFPSSPSLYLLH